MHAIMVRQCPLQKQLARPDGSREKCSRVCAGNNYNRVQCLQIKKTSLLLPGHATDTNYAFENQMYGTFAEHARAQRYTQRESGTCSDHAPAKRARSLLAADIAAASTDSRSVRITWAGSSAPKMALPATTTLAPACAACCDAS